MKKEIPVYLAVSTNRPSIRGKIGNLDVGDNFPVLIMGVINLTGDSFYGGSIRRSVEEVKSEALKMQADGADIIDIGARSTAPYKKFDIPVSEEEASLREAVAVVTKAVKIPVSADTTRFASAKAALDSGATILNDVYGLQGEDSDKIGRLVSSSGCSVILCAHERVHGGSTTPMERVISALWKSIELCNSFGIDRESISIDPAIGFFKDDHVSNTDWNLIVLAELEKLRDFRLPICVGVSRKRFLGELIGDKPPEYRLFPSVSASSIAVYNGAQIIRTHDVRATKEAAVVAEAIRKKKFIRPWP